MELVIYNPTEEVLLDGYEILFNNEEIKTELAERLKKYQGLTYTDEQIKDAKADRANLNKFKEAIEAKRKEIKKACLAPYENFEKKIKEITAMIDAPIKAIDEQIKAYEQIKKDEKQQAIVDYYAGHVGELATLVPFEKVFNEKWLNATYKEKDIHNEMQALFSQVEADLQVLEEMGADNQLKQFYLKNYDLTATLQEKKRLEEQAARLAEYEKAQADRKAQEKPLQAKPQSASETNISPPVEEEPVYTLAFQVRATKAQLAALKQFFLENNIVFSRLDNQSERKAV